MHEGWGWMTEHGDVHHYKTDGTTLCGLQSADFFHRERERPRSCEKCADNKAAVDAFRP